MDGGQNILVLDGDFFPHDLLSGGKGVASFDFDACPINFRTQGKGWEGTPCITLVRDNNSTKVVSLISLLKSLFWQEDGQRKQYRSRRKHNARG